MPFQGPGELTAVIDEPVTGGILEHAAKAARAADTRRSWRVVFIAVLQTVKGKYEDEMSVELKFTHNGLMTIAQQGQPLRLAPVPFQIGSFVIDSPPLCSNR